MLKSMLSSLRVKIPQGYFQMKIAKHGLKFQVVAKDFLQYHLSHDSKLKSVLSNLHGKIP